MPALEAWELVYIGGSNAEAFLNSVHGSFSCQGCHLGAADGTFETMAEAHAGLVRDPSAQGACNACHDGIAKATAASLHTNLWGEKAAIGARCDRSFASLGIDAYFDSKCGECHTTCGQCHISRPNSVGGGFPKFGGIVYSAHRINRRPDMDEQCMACHGSRIGTDFRGEIAGNAQDVHRARGMHCMDCHSAAEIHGDGLQTGEHYEHRYEVQSMPRCEECHVVAGDGNNYHAAHVNGFSGANLQCQVCHSQPYKNCTNCHDLVDDDVKGDKFQIDPSVVQLKIARNPSPHRGEYDFALVRHTPIDPGTYADWGLALPAYTAVPTWQYTSPHNVQRRTPQTTVPEGSGCAASCHGAPGGTEGIFLREIDLYEADGVTRLPDYDANIGIVMDER